MHYYYSGVASWGWFYDYHYAPRISGTAIVSCTLSSIDEIDIYHPLDLQGVDKMEFNFDLGTPFKPFEQLMGVLPVASKDFIPQAYQVSLGFHTLLREFSPQPCTRI